MYIMNKTHNEWAEFIRFMLRFYGKKNLYDYDDFIYRLANQCEGEANMQTAVHYCSDKIHEFIMSKR